MYFPRKLNYIEIHKGFDRGVESPLRSAYGRSDSGILRSSYFEIFAYLQKVFLISLGYISVLECINNKAMKIMNRKNIHIILLVITGLVFTICPVYAIAQNRKGQIFYSKNDGLYWAAIETSYFKAYVARQRSENWCWAACTQMVLNYQGVSASQEQIVERVFGSRVDRPGTAQNIVQGASGWYVDGHTIGAKADYSFLPQKLIDDLVNKYPLVVGLSMPGQNVGHAYVLTGLSFQKEGDSIYPQSVILRDPWPDNQSRLVLSWRDFSSRAHTIVHIFPN